MIPTATATSISTAIEIAMGKSSPDALRLAWIASHLPWSTSQRATIRAGTPLGYGRGRHFACWRVVDQISKLMTRNLDEVHIRNWTNLGTTAPVPRWSVDLIVRWTRDDGTKGEHSRTVVFPNILANVPLRRVRGDMGG